MSMDFLYKNKRQDNLSVIESNDSDSSIPDRVKLDPRVGTLNEEIQSKFDDLEEGKTSNDELVRDVLNILKKDDLTEQKKRPSNKPK